jgi:uncharacterized protein YndB with AHSA1/START domain
MSVSITATIDAPITTVWALVADFANLTRWHPAVERCEATGNTPGATRKIFFADWWAEERLDVLDPAQHILGYSIIGSDVPPVIGVRGTIGLTKLDEGRTSIVWESGLPPENPNAATVNAGLEAYYPTRIGHLRKALGLA